MHYLKGSLISNSNGVITVAGFTVNTNIYYLTKFRVGFVLFNDTWSSVRTFGIMYDHAFSKLSNHQIRHQAAHIVGCQPGYSISSL